MSNAGPERHSQATDVGRSNRVTSRSGRLIARTSTIDDTASRSFDLDAALARARQVTGRDDPAAHLESRP